MRADVIILAQGTQKRLGMQYGWKQLIHLPGCGNARILERTVRQLVGLYIPETTSVTITVVTWPEIAAAFPDMSYVGHAARFVTLRAPGNSSLKGIARYLESAAIARDAPPRGDRTIVLLGDVVYSWACLEAIVALSATHGFVGTSDLSHSGGELWGLSWHQGHDDHMITELRDALTMHPPFEDDYQPGQLRRWIQGFRRGDLADRVAKLTRAGNYVAIDDYTMDVDVEAHLAKIKPTSALAAEDDARHGLLWGASR